MKKCKCSDKKTYDVLLDQTCYDYCVSIGTFSGTEIGISSSFKSEYTYDPGLVALGAAEIENYQKEKVSIKYIQNIIIDDENLKSTGETRKYSIFGTPGAVFTLTVENEDPIFYNFATRSFASSESSSTKLSKVKIPSSGVYNGSIVFPSVSDDDLYKVSILAHQEENTALVGNNYYQSKLIYQYTDKTITFDGFTTSSSYSSTGSTTITSTILNSGTISHDVTMSLALSSDSMAIKRQPVPEDFETKITRTIAPREEVEMPHRSTSGNDFFRYEYTDVSLLAVGGRAVSGNRISVGTVIPQDSSQFIGSIGDDFDGGYSKDDVFANPSIDTIKKTVILSTKSDLTSGSDVDFYYPSTNSSQTEMNVGSIFKIKNANLRLDKFTTTTTASTIGSSSTTIAVSSINGIEKHVTPTVNGATSKATSVLVSSSTGLYVGQVLYDVSSGSLTKQLPSIVSISVNVVELSIPQTLNHGATLYFLNSTINSPNMITSSSFNFVPVINIAGSNIFSNPAQELENGETIIINKTGRNATLKFTVEFTKIGIDNFTIFPNLDNFIEII